MRTSYGKPSTEPLGCDEEFTASMGCRDPHRCSPGALRVFYRFKHLADNYSPVNQAHSIGKPRTGGVLMVQSRQRPERQGIPIPIRPRSAPQHLLLEQR